MEALANRARFALYLSFIASVSMFIPTTEVLAGSYRTENFIVTAPTRALAAEIAQAAERYRSELAIEWLGHTLPRWSEPCPIKAQVSPELGAGGATSFLFETYEHQYARPVNHRTGDGLFQAKPVGRPFGWEMTIQGSRERVLDSVLPHEVTHTIFATHFGRPLPRWADEGACTTVEHASEKAKQHRMLYEFLKTERGIAFNQMFSMNEYPADILPLYSQGFSLARYLIAQGGKRKFIKYLEDGLNSNNWTASTQQHYDFESLSELQVTWLDWVRRGSPELPAGGRQPQLEKELSPGTTLSASPNKRSKSFVSTTSPNPSMSKRGESWYVSRSRQTHNNIERGVKPEFDRNADRRGRSTSWVPSTRVASRPEPPMRQREVLFEWGQPTPILAATQADEPSSRR